MGEISAQRAVIRVRASRYQLEQINQAAQVQGMSRSVFILDAACRRAEEIILDQSHFNLDDDAYAEFTKLLDSPPEPTDELRNLLNSKALWK